MKIVLVGKGAQAKYALEIFSYYQDVEIVGLIDIENDGARGGKLFCEKPVLGGLDLLGELDIMGVGGVLVCCADPQKKASLTERVHEAELSLVNAIHPKATLARTAQIGNGVIINAGAVIQPFARIGDGVMIHANVVVEHDNVIEDYVNLAPGVTLAGWVRVKSGAILYTGAVAIPKVKIGRGAVVGAGALLLEDVPDAAVTVGVPARVIRYRKTR